MCNKSLAGRQVGVRNTNGTDMGVLDELRVEFAQALGQEDDSQVALEEAGFLRPAQKVQERGPFLRPIMACRRLRYDRIGIFQDEGYPPSLPDLVQ